jgi:hypothetical protein
MRGINMTKGDERIKELELEIEESIGLLYSKFFQLRQLGEYELEYNLMGTLLQMLLEDRKFIRENYKGKWNE